MISSIYLITERTPGPRDGSITYNLRFPGQYYNRETGVHYNGLRDYDPTTDRYVQSDPIGLSGGTNTYEYVGDDPVTFIDVKRKQYGTSDIAYEAFEKFDRLNYVLLGAECISGAWAGWHYSKSILDYNAGPSAACTSIKARVGNISLICTCQVYDVKQSHPTYSPINAQNCGIPNNDRNSIMDVMRQISAPRMSIDPSYEISQLKGSSSPPTYHLAEPDDPLTDPDQIIGLKVLWPHDQGYPN